jgi:predicted amidohydrolase YtcJ
MLIRNAEIHFATLADIHIVDDKVVAIGKNITAAADDIIIDAGGNSVIPGLHDHHIHFMSYAAALDSVRCGPPQVHDTMQLQQILQKKAQMLRGRKSTTWLRGIGYHDSVAGVIDRNWLDRIVSDVPVRIQHRSGRLWIFNSRALALLGDLTATPLEQIDSVFSGRLYDADGWLRERIGRQLPDVHAASLQLAKYGFTGFTDTTPHNNAETLQQFAALQQRGDLLQHVVLMGDASLDRISAQKNIRAGATKIHLHDSELPDFAAMCEVIRSSHAVNRPVAIHCVTLTELVFSLNALEDTGSIRGDRIEHAAITSPDMLQQLKNLNLIVVTQPNFISERGDAYLRDVDAADQPWLYRLRAFVESGVPLAGGTDASFGHADPWTAMQAAVTRRTSAGKVIGADESLSAEAALELFLGDPLLPGNGRNHIEIGDRADFCVLDRPWQQARKNLAEVGVIKTIKSAEVIWLK